MKKIVIFLIASLLLTGCGSTSGSNRRQLKETATVITFKESLPIGEIDGMQIEKVGSSGSEYIVMQDKEVALESLSLYYDELLSTDFIPLDGDGSVYCYAMLIQNEAGTQRYYYGYNEEIMIDTDSFGTSIYDEEYVNILKGLYDYYAADFHISIDENNDLTIYKYEGEGFYIKSELGESLNNDLFYSDICNFDFKSYGLSIYEDDVQLDAFPSEQGEHIIILSNDNISYQLVYTATK